MQESFLLKLADVCMRVHPLFPETQAFCADYLVSGETPEFEITVTEEALQKEETLAQLYRGFAPSSLQEAERLALYRAIAERMPRYGTFLMHGSAVSVDGNAYVFTAPSGTGKSTHAEMWRRQFGSRFVIINDDKPLLRVKGERIWVCGTPWSGKDGRNTNCSIPLKAIAFLRQAEHNQIIRLDKGVCWDLLMNQIYRSGSLQTMTQTIPLVDQLLSLVPVYQLDCNMEMEAVRVSYECLSGQPLEEKQ